ncbi:hypothetical protein [Streptomyces cellulosae]|uniref:Uncharacterized protein n=1 Tax=Streptomyces cellulosae TaxID=1968 RepID=A0ABW7YCM7_STRCE
MSRSARVVELSGGGQDGDPLGSRTSADAASIPSRRADLILSAHHIAPARYRSAVAAVMVCPRALVGGE